MINKNGVQYLGIFPYARGVYLFEEPNSPGQFTAKLAEFKQSRVMKRGDVSHDGSVFGEFFLDDIFYILYYQAYKRARSVTPCAPEDNNNFSGHDPWLLEVCEIVSNLYRVSRSLQRKKDRWSLERVLEDAWVNGVEME